jgi:hypothetical protein
MMSPEQVKTVTYIYGLLMASEIKEWEKIDEYLQALEWLSYFQLCNECEALYSIHQDNHLVCPYIEGEESTHFIVSMLEAVEAITQLYRETEDLHPRNRYILCYYLALCQDGQLVSTESSAV